MLTNLKFKKVNYSRIAVYVLVIALVTFTAMPLVYLVNTAVKPLDEMFVFPPEFFVRRPTFRNFTELFTVLDNSTVPFLRYLFNSFFVSVVTVGGTVLVCTMGAFAIKKLKLPHANGVFNLIIATLMFSPPVSQITNYLLISQLHMMNTVWAMIIPKIAGSYFLFLLAQNFGEIPDALLEAAKIDGCSYWGLYSKMVIPLTRPAWATAIVFAFVASWNDFTGPMLYIQNESLKTLPLALQLLQGGTGQVARQGAFAAATLLTTLPTIIVFVSMQSKVIKTMAHSGIK
jgi:ABC-type glycerol-3-phosphate transport system permease component